MALRRESRPQEYAPTILRELRRGDLPACCRIDRMTAFGPPWNESMWHDNTKEFPSIVASQNGLVAGFVIYEHRVTSVKILKLAVHPHVWRSGVGTCLLGRAFEYAVLAGKNYVEATVPLEIALIPALNLFKYLGWPGYMTEHGDGVRFVKENKLIVSH